MFPRTRGTITLIWGCRGCIWRHNSRTVRVDRCTIRIPAERRLLRTQILKVRLRLLSEIRCTLIYQSHVHRISLCTELREVFLHGIGVSVGSCLINIRLGFLLGSLGTSIIDSLPHLRIHIIERHIAPRFEHRLQGVLDSFLCAAYVVTHFGKRLAYFRTEGFNRLHKLLHLREAVLHRCCHLVDVCKFCLLTSLVCFIEELLVA